MRKSRAIGGITGGILGFLIGSGTGIVGGPFVAVAGVSVFTVIGIGWGLSAGPDVADKLKAWRSSR